MMEKLDYIRTEQMEEYLSYWHSKVSEETLNLAISLAPNIEIALEGLRIACERLIHRTQKKKAEG